MDTQSLLLGMSLHLVDCASIIQLQIFRETGKIGYIWLKNAIKFNLQAFNFCYFLIFFRVRNILITRIFNENKNYNISVEKKAKKRWQSTNISWAWTGSWLTLSVRLIFFYFPFEGNLLKIHCVTEIKLKFKFKNAFCVFNHIFNFFVIDFKFIVLLMLFSYCITIQRLFQTYQILGQNFEKGVSFDCV